VADYTWRPEDVRSARLLTEDTSLTGAALAAVIAAAIAPLQTAIDDLTTRVEALEAP
jgi:hypothetical protein